MRSEAELFLEGVKFVTDRIKDVAKHEKSKRISAFLIAMADVFDSASAVYAQAIYPETPDQPTKEVIIEGGYKRIVVDHEDKGNNST